MATTARISERITAITTGGGAFALASLVPILSHYGYEFQPWAWAVWAVVDSLLAIVCVGLFVHLAWLEVRRLWTYLRQRKLSPYGRVIHSETGKYIVGGRAEDEPGVIVGPMEIAKALESWKGAEADPPIKVKRDTRLAEALMYAVSGEWGKDPMTDGGNLLGALATATSDFCQYAADGAITVWGRAGSYGVHQVIAPSYWLDHNVAFLDVLRSETRAKAINQSAAEPLFEDLMVCRAEIEAEWQRR